MAACLVTEGKEGSADGKRPGGGKGSVQSCSVKTTRDGCCSAEDGGGLPGFCSGLLNYRSVCVEGVCASMI